MILCFGGGSSPLAGELLGGFGIVDMFGATVLRNESGGGPRSCDAREYRVRS
jgi:hypothetical protein